MQRSGEAARPDREASATDWFGVSFHGFGVTHLDSLGHVFWNQVAYGGAPAHLVNTQGGATIVSIEDACDFGLVSRGVLLDIPRHRGVEWLDPGDSVTGDELVR